jgi:glycosyltransferase involved in cell wall biosynthesis
MARDLFISAFAPTFGSGRALRTYTVVRALAELGPLDLAYVPFEGEDPAALYAAIPDVTFHAIRPSRGVRRALTYARRRLEGYRPGAARGASPEIAQCVARLAAAPDRGRVIAGDMIVMCALMELARRRPVIFNSHNIESSREHDPDYGRPRWLPTTVTERRILRRAAECWMVSPDDIEQARVLAPGARLRLAPNVVDVANIPVAPAHRGGRLALMVADFTYTRNVEALDLLLAEVMPRVWQRLPDAQVRLVGRGLENRPPMDARVHAVGFVDRLGPVYADATVVVVPLVGGGGTSLKFLEAMAYGVPVVSTSQGARGLHVRPGEHYREGDDWPRFADEVVSIMERGDPGMAAAARAVAEQDFSVRALAELLDPALAPIVAV